MNKKKILVILIAIVLFLPLSVFAKQTGLVIEDGKKYYYNEDGTPYKGFKEVDGKLYFFSYVTRTTLKGWFSPNGVDYYYGNEDGTLKRGLHEIDGKKYYFDENGVSYKGFKEVDGELYFFSYITRTTLKGWFSPNGVDYYYSNEDGTLKRGLYEIDGKKYYFDENGISYKGFKEVDGELYFFSYVTRTTLKGWFSPNGVDHYYGNEDGTLKRGLYEIDGKKYYFDENGVSYKGFKEVDGELYFFSYVTRTTLKGWNSTDGFNYFYGNDDGTLKRGTFTIDGREYKFNDKTGLLDGFKIIDNKTYYYDPDGTLNKGIQYMAGKFWKFNATTGAFEKHVRQIRVIDISTHNGVIDWNKVKASNQVDGVILRLGYGQRFIDSRFSYNKSELERLGIPYSVYLFSYAENKTEAQKEADFVVRTIQNEAVKIASNIFSVYYDLEDWEITSTGENSYGINQDTYGQMITTFVNTIESKLGVKGRVYASKNYIETRFPVYARDYATWVAQWNDTITYKGNYEGWQYSSTGTVPGINGNVDMNIFYY